MNYIETMLVENKKSKDIDLKTWVNHWVTYKLIEKKELETLQAKIR